MTTDKGPGGMPTRTGGTGAEYRVGTARASEPADALHVRDEVPLVVVLAVLLRRWRPIAIMAIVGGLVGLAVALTGVRQYASSALFIPQGSEGGALGLAAAASQFGIRIPTANGGVTWSPPVYVELVRSPGLLDSIAGDTLVVGELGGQRMAVSDLLRVRAPNERERRDATIKALQRTVDVFEERTLGGVRIVVQTPWPSVSHALATKILAEVNRFNLESRKLQAAAERQFVESQAAEADSALRDAEEQLRDFKQRNRVALSPELTLENERLVRAVSLRQQLFLWLLQGREEARIREVRNTPLISVVESPRVPVVGEPRGSVQKAVLGAIAGGILGLILAFLAEWAGHARRSVDPPTQEFFIQLDRMIPRFLRGAR